MRVHTIEINPSTCIGCGLCVGDCPSGNLALRENKAALNSQDCIKCGHCVAICPKGAVSMSGFDEPPMELDALPHLDTQQLLHALRARRSIRQFTPRPISSQVLHNILEAGRWTPTAKNASSISYLVVKEKNCHVEALAVRYFRRIMPLVRLLYPAAKGHTIDDAFFFKNAPIVIAVISKDKISASLAASNMALVAESQGLGVLYSGFFSMAANLSPTLHKELGLARGEKVVTTLVLGYSAVTYRRTTQKDPPQVANL